MGAPAGFVMMGSNTVGHRHGGIAAGNRTGQSQGDFAMEWLIPVLIVVALVAIAGIYLWATYNSLITLKVCLKFKSNAMEIKRSL